MSHKNRIKPVQNLEARVDMTVMANLSLRFRVAQYSMFCGYLRQPLSYQDHGTSLSVNGYCVLTGNYCTRQVPTQGAVYESCSIYHAKVK